MRNFKIIIITDPGIIEDEASKITALLDAGVDYVHIRKPDWTLREVKDLIESIPFQYRKQLKLHGHFELFNELTLGGAHINSRNSKIPINALSVSKSCHSIADVKNSAALDYVTLSPIFNSISKYGYQSQFEIDEISPEIISRRVVALGGVTPDKFKMLREKGFYGAALLGYIWSGDFHENLSNLKTFIQE